MNVALVMTGLLRDFEKASINIKERIINRFNIHPKNVFISVWNDRGYWYPADSLERRSFAPSGLVTFDQICKIYPNSKIDLEDFNQLKTHFYSLLEPYKEVFLPEQSHSNYMVRGVNLLSMLYKINKGLLMALSTNNFTHVIRTRPDIHFTSNLPNFDKSRMIVAKHKSHLGKGIGDNYHSGLAHMHIPIMKIIDNLPFIVERSQGIFCPHVIMQTAFESARIPYLEKRIQYQTLHTPNGMYKYKNSEAEWVTASSAQYQKTQGFFSGKQTFN